MNLIKTAIPDVLILEPQVFGDERGYFMETFRQQWLSERGIEVNFVQDNQSASSQGVLRGLHYQVKQPQGKLVRVIQGEVYDVAVDLRPESPTWGQHVGVILSAENRRQLWVPPGFAHGFYVISERAAFIYKCTDYYAPEHERVLRWDDPALNIPWPIPAGTSPTLSPKDKAGTPLAEAELPELIAIPLAQALEKA